MSLEELRKRYGGGNDDEEDEDEEEEEEAFVFDQEDAVDMKRRWLKLRLVRRLKMSRTRSRN